MTEKLPRSLTCEVEVEQILRDSAACDLFGPPPITLVEHAMAATRKPCEQRTAAPRVQRSTALIVLSLAAAGLFLSTLPSFSEWQRKRNIEATGLSPAPEHSQMQATVVLPDPEPSTVRQPTGGQVLQASTMEQVSLAPAMRRHIRRVRQPAPKAIWTTTVVSETEQGIVLPVVAAISNGENDQAEQVQTGVAVVPLQSGLTYTEYTGPGLQ